MNLMMNRSVINGNKISLALSLFPGCTLFVRLATGLILCQKLKIDAYSRGTSIHDSLAKVIEKIVLMKGTNLQSLHILVLWQLPNSVKR